MENPPHPTNTLRIAFVVDSSDCYDESGVQIVDIISIFPVADNNIYLIQTEPFNDRSLSLGAGRAFRPDQITTIMTNLHHLPHLK